MEINGNASEVIPTNVDALAAICPAGDELLELTTRGALRILVPMRDWRVRWSGSKLYPALSWKGRAHRAALRLWMTTGGVRTTHRISARRKGSWPLGDLLRPDLPTLSTAAVSVGPPGRGQNITAQVMDEGGRVLGYAKYADKLLTRTRLLNEARMLEVIPANVGPRLIRHVSFMDGDVLVQTPLPGRARTPRLELDHSQMRLLGRLVKPEQTYAASDHPFIAALLAQADGRRSLLESVVADLATGQWPLACMHGDLAPWNVRWWRGECFAFDWECGSRDGFAYVDAAYNLIQVASLVRRIGPRQAKQVITEILSKRLPPPYARYASPIAELAALYTLVSWYPPQEADPHADWLGAFVEEKV